MAADIRQRCLEEATRLFVAHGYHGISMREIAEQVGVSKANLYHHFRDKEALFLAVLEENLARLDAIVHEARQRESTPRGRITHILLALAASAPEQRAIIRLADQELGQISPQARETFGRLYHERFTGPIEAILQEGMAAGVLRPMDVHQATWALLGMVYPFFHPTSEAIPPPTAETIHQLVSLFFDGLTPRA
ncbi:MAG: TetR/AcrR family transcriptional regulator [Anaerolineae bacterium]|nr:TetR/AcrR family transcriptional regulator [Caldilineales bacterium]MDW8270626.1 TetR/AcrR family transcriptional regulator [Anaerolineae bacterium]